ncbi:hypothetical protein [Rhizobium sp. TRM95796]|uniref:hypothetical protein n=1 Tax=Rhizobium sp. TRM95796 TaxID=2979862 RepID=UPI0021E72D25|nr:hypothetical protein [Rhizobium sp. TRM95796]MCV3765194.1 hypothetical protein [Rhizobium sp. TRM95796]
MTKQMTRDARKGKITMTGGKLTSERGEKISAVEGLRLTPRMEAVLLETRGRPGDERRAAIKAHFRSKIVS